MTPMYSTINNGDEQFVTVILPGIGPRVAGNTHPNFDRIMESLTGDDEVSTEEYERLFDTSVAVAERFTRLSDRVSVSNGHVYLDGDLQDDAITNQIVRFLDEDQGDWYPLVRFMENVAANPSEHSRTQLYDWLRAHEFTLTNEGNIVGYKGVAMRDDGSLVSCQSGRAIVDGEVVTGQIPNAVGSIVEMPRSEVTHDPATSCSTGLHVGTYDYALSWARGRMLRVDVNPRDVVSVPTHANGKKVRVCRYKVVEVIDAPLSGAYTGNATTDDDCDGWDF